MIINYIKIAWRNLKRQKLYSLINLLGLAVGLAVCMTIMLYVSHEMSYDHFHVNAKRIFKLQAQIKVSGNVMNADYMSYSTGPIIKQSQPLVQNYMRVLNYFKPLVVNNSTLPGEKFTEKKLLFADAGFFKFFSFKLLSGNAADVLSKPFAVVISQDIAEKYFGHQNPIGKTLVIKTDSAYTYQVTGVAQNAPSNSSITFNFVTSNQSLLAMPEAVNYIGEPRISAGSFEMYLLLNSGSDAALLKKSIDRMVSGNKIYADQTFRLTALTDSHLKNNDGDLSNVKYLKLFPVVALLILLLALVNYMSLCTARATIRAKEVGVRKVSGASRKSIAMQFYVESALFTCIAFVMGYVLCYLFTPWFLNVLQLKIDSSFLYSPVVLALLFGLLLFTIVVAGSYPALVLSAFKPAITLKGKMGRQTGGITVRKIFTTFQFTIAVALIICGIVIDRQLYFFRHADIGVNRDNVIMVPVSNSFGKNYQAFKHDVQSLSGVSNTATSQYGMFKGYDVYFINGKTKGESLALPSIDVDAGFVTTLGLKWKIAPVLNTVPTSRNRVYINEAAVQQLHLPANAVDSKIQSAMNELDVAGVLKNFNFASMEYVIQPLALSIIPDTTSDWAQMGCNLFAKVKPGTNLPQLIANIESAYKKYDRNTPFSYSFVDDAFNAQYTAEDRLAAIFSVFTCITIILAALGLFGLAAFTIEQRTKEIGIRKVLGASLSAITTLLSKDFLNLVFLAIVIASPIAWYVMNSWLQNFAYRIAIHWWVFITAGLVATGIALITISYHSLKAAIANPVKSLRSE